MSPRCSSVWKWHTFWNRTVFVRGPPDTLKYEGWIIRHRGLWERRDPSAQTGSGHWSPGSLSLHLHRTVSSRTTVEPEAISESLGALSTVDNKRVSSSVLYVIKDAIMASLYITASPGARFL